MHTYIHLYCRDPPGPMSPQQKVSAVKRGRGRPPKPSGSKSTLQEESEGEVFDQSTDDEHMEGWYILYVCCKARKKNCTRKEKCKSF